MFHSVQHHRIDVIETHFVERALDGRTAFRLGLRARFRVYHHRAPVHSPQRGANVPVTVIALGRVPEVHAPIERIFKKIRAPLVRQVVQDSHRWGLCRNKGGKQPNPLTRI